MSRSFWNVFSWLWVVFCVTGACVWGANIGTALVVLSGVLAIPCETMRELWSYSPNSINKYLVVPTLFILGAILQSY